MSQATTGNEPELSFDSARAKSRMENRDYVWKYWSFHAEQRLKTFNFFILFTTVLVAGSLAYVKDASQPNLAAPCGLLMFAICWLFWRLDCRNRELIRHAEGILKQIEKEIPTDVVPENQRLFCVEDCETSKRCAGSALISWNAPLSFYQVFQLTFVVFGILGLLLFFGALLMPSRTRGSSMPVQNFYLGLSAEVIKPSTKAVSQKTDL